MTVRKSEELHLALYKAVLHAAKHRDMDVLRRVLQKVNGRVTTPCVALWIESSTPFKASIEGKNGITLAKPASKQDWKRFDVEFARTTHYWDLDPPPTAGGATLKELTSAAFREFLKDPSSERYVNLLVS